MITLIDSTAYITKKRPQTLNIRIAPVTYYVKGQIYHEIYSDCNGDFINFLNVQPATTAKHPKPMSPRF